MTKSTKQVIDQKKRELESIVRELEYLRRRYDEWRSGFSSESQAFISSNTEVGNPIEHATDCVANALNGV